MAHESNTRLISPVCAGPWQKNYRWEPDIENQEQSDFVWEVRLYIICSCPIYCTVMSDGQRCA